MIDKEEPDIGNYIEGCVEDWVCRVHGHNGKRKRKVDRKRGNKSPKGNQSGPNRTQGRRTSLERVGNQIESSGNLAGNTKLLKNSGKIVQMGLVIGFGGEKGNNLLYATPVEQEGQRGLSACGCYCLQRDINQQQLDCTANPETMTLNIYESFLLPQLLAD
ncbi:hypothetical protein CPB85DRAFT_1252406 [Mucidula mucida]|nr:hypothetical protein CPB85DRAFT_1252406 [Mucidula mucida]